MQSTSNPIIKVIFKGSFEPDGHPGDTRQELISRFPLCFASGRPI